jgi:hypothetical protein
LHGKTNLSDKFSIKNSLKHVLEYAIRRVQAGQGDMKFNGSRHILVYADRVNLLGERGHVTKRDTQASLVASRKMGLEVSAEKSKC